MLSISMMRILFYVCLVCFFRIYFEIGKDIKSTELLCEGSHEHSVRYIH